METKYPGWPGGSSGKRAVKVVRASGSRARQARQATGCFEAFEKASQASIFDGCGAAAAIVGVGRANGPHPSTVAAPPPGWHRFNPGVTNAAAIDYTNFNIATVVRGL